MNFNEALQRYKDGEDFHSLAVSLREEMTQKEKIKLLSGHAMGKTVKGVFSSGRVYNAYPYPAGGCKRLGIPEVQFADGPRGVVPGHSTAFPVSMLRGATFETELEYRVGKAIAREAISQGANYFAGICINLLRHPKWGRAQETYGEEPLLLGNMGAALTRAVQEEGMIACPKHYALNSIEDLRFQVNAVVSERTLQEVYLPHFKKCIDAGALSLMGAYNKVNGEYSCHNAHLLDDILRKQWGFDGFVCSDFMWGVYDAEPALKAGLDLEMPYTVHYRKIGKYLKSGKLSIEHVDRAVDNIIGVMLRAEAKHKDYPKDVIFCEEHRALAKEVALKGMVLLKNDGVLPLADTQTKLGVVGRYANEVNTGDHGSSRVYCPHIVTPYEGIKAKYPNAVVYNGTDCDKALAATSGCDVVLVCVGSDHKDEGEFLVNLKNINKKPAFAGGDRASLAISDTETALIRGLVNAGKKVIVGIIGGSAYVISDWVDAPNAIIECFYSGTEGGNALAELLSGTANFSGKLPFTMAERGEDYPRFIHIGERPYEIEYGYYHGYRLFESEKLPVLFPFGYGLSYTTFELSAPKTKVSANGINVEVDVKNSGEREGRTVVQVYAASTKPERPVKRLAGYAPCELKAGETKRATVQILSQDLAFFNEETSKFELDDEYVLTIGFDSKDERGKPLKVAMPQ